MTECCKNCVHKEMCGWQEQKEDGGCDFFLDFGIYTKKLSQGQIIKTLFPNITIQEHGKYYIVDFGDHVFEFDKDWWDAPYDEKYDRMAKSRR